MSKTPELDKVNWSENKGAVGHVIRLLEASGALLETQVARLCQEFANDRHKKQGVSVSTNAITYGRPIEESPLRQIDQCLSLYKEFVLDEYTGVQLHVQLPIEVKYRKDVEVFGIEYPPKSYRPRFPLTGFLRGSQLSVDLKPIIPSEDLTLAHTVFLEIREGTTPQRIHDENLAYNAAGALYDFIKFDLQRDEEQESAHEAKIIRDMGLLERFGKYLAENHYIPWPVLQKWMAENLSDKLVDEFNRRFGRRFSKGRISYGINAHVPVLCLNGELWSFHSGKFQTQDALLMRVRIPNWPGLLRRDLIRYTAEAPLVVTNMKGLKQILNEGLTWFLRLEHCLKSADKQLKRRWHLESAFYREAVNECLREYPEDNLRSDLDVFNWLHDRII